MKLINDLFLQKDEPGGAVLDESTHKAVKKEEEEEEDLVVKKKKKKKKHGKKRKYDEVDEKDERQVEVKKVKSNSTFYVDVKYEVERSKKETGKNKTGLIILQMTMEDSITDIVKQLKSLLSDVTAINEVKLHVENGDKRYTVIGGAWEKYKEMLQDENYTIFAYITVAKHVLLHNIPFLSGASSRKKLDLSKPPRWTV
jgi:hypothetical protein